MTQTSQFTILNISIVLLDKTEYPILLNNFNSLTIHETIYQKGIIGEFSFFDAYDYLSLIPLIGGETLLIDIIDVNDDRFTEKFIITERSEITNREGTGFNDITLKIIEKNYYDLISKNFVQGIHSRTDSINSIIDYILSSNNPNFKLDDDSIVIPNKISISAFPSIYTIDEIFHYIIENNGDINTGKTYMFYNRKTSKFILVSDKDMSKKNNYGFFSFSDKYGENVENYIFHFKSFPSHNTKILNNNGFLHSNTYNLDSKNKKLNINRFGFNDFMDIYNQKLSSVSSEMFSYGETTSKFWSYVPFLYQNDLEIQYMNRASNHFRRSTTYMLTIAGRFNLYIGDKITPLFKKPYDSINAYETLDGEYIVTGITHKFGSDAIYTQDIVISKGEILSSDKYSTRLIERRTK